MNKRVGLVLLVLAALIGGAMLWSRATRSEAVALETSSDTGHGPARSEPEAQPRAPDTQRESRRTQEAARPAESAAATGTLIVRCIDLKTREPMRDVALEIYPEVDPAAEDFEEQIRAEAFRLRATTREDGNCEIQVPAGIAIDVRASSKSGDFEDVVEGVEALEPGGRRELTLGIKLEPQVVMHVRVVDHATGVGIAGARIERSEGEGPDVQCDAAGRCTLRFARPRRISTSTSEDGPMPLWFCRVHADGYGVAEFQESAGHEREEIAFDMSLSKAATLVVSLLARTDSSAGAYEVCAKTEASGLIQNASLLDGYDFSALQFRAACDVSGRVQLENLPAGVPLTLAVFRGTQSIRTHPEELLLEPGEERTLEIDLGPGCHLRGRVIDSGGAVVSQLDLWLVPSVDEYLHAQFDEYEEKECIAKARSDSIGQFDLGEIPAGKYGLGPAPIPFEPKDKTDLPDVAAVNVLVEIAPEERSKELDLRVHRGLSIRGTVVRPDGTPMTETVQVYGRSETDHQVHGSSQADGTFVISPLVESTYTLHATHGGAFDDSLEIEVAAGARDAVLRLRLGASFSGRVVEEPGGPGVQASLMLTYVDGSHVGLSRMSNTDTEGRFTLSTLSPGRIALVATVADGRVGLLSSLDLAGGVKIPDVEMLVAPGARLRVRHTSHAKLDRAEMLHGNVLVARLGTLGEDVTGNVVVVPPGELTVRVWLAEGGEELEQKVRVSAGEDREVVFP